MKGQTKRFTMNDKTLTHEEMLEIAEQREEANRVMEEESLLNETEITENNGTLQD
jgi:hypothetical protein